MNIYKRRLRYRCWHRGTREADLLLGNFFDSYYEKLSQNQKKLFVEFIDNITDTDILYYIFGEKPWPGNLSKEIIVLFNEFIKKENYNKLYS